MADESLIPLKRSGPSSPEEAVTVELLRKIGGPQTLPPEALSRIAHRVRETGARKRVRPPLFPPLFTDARVALFAAGLAVVVIVSTSTFLMFMKGEREPSTPRAQIALRSTPSQTSEPDELAPPRPTAPRFAQPPPPSSLRPSNDEEAALKEDRTGTGRARTRTVVASADAPRDPGVFDVPHGGGYRVSMASAKGGAPAPAAIPAEKFAEKKKPMGPSRAGSGEASAEAPADGVAEKSADDFAENANGLERRADTNSDKAFVAQEAAAPAGVASAARAAAPVPAPASVQHRAAEAPTEDRALNANQAGAQDECTAKYPAVSGQSEAAERALFSRARCHLDAGARTEGQKELRAYLSRFPLGLFASKARELLK